MVDYKSGERRIYLSTHDEQNNRQDKQRSPSGLGVKLHDGNTR